MQNAESDIVLTSEDLIELLELVSLLHADGHYTILKFTSGYKVMIGTPDLDNGCRSAISKIKTHDTFQQAIIAELKRISKERRTII
jgi:hypothetical protein